MKYKTEEERKAAKREYMKRYYQKNKEKKAEYYKHYYQVNKEKRVEQKKQWYQDNKEKVLEQKKQYNKTPMGRALYLVDNHNQADKQMGRGECSLTSIWIYNYIFPFKCIYCGESDWHKLGCDRKDNSLPHTPNNVVPCCGGCNRKRQKKTFETFVAECNAQERLKEWEEFLKQKDLEGIATT